MLFITTSRVLHQSGGGFMRRQGVITTSQEVGRRISIIRSSAFSTAAKEKKGNKKKTGVEGEGGDATKNTWYIKLIDQPPGSGSKALSDEQRAKNHEIGKRYNIEYNRRQAAQNADLHRKIKLKLEAIQALPTEELREEARTIDALPVVPPTRRLTTWTPPIPNFEAGKYDLPGAV